MSQRILVLHDYNDRSAFWLKEQLFAFGVQDAVFLVGDELTIGAAFAYEANNDNSTFRITTAKGTTIDNEAFNLILNRIAFPGIVLRELTAVEDREFVQGEIYALTICILAGFSGKLINAPKVGSLSGTSFTQADWAVLASMAGLKHVSQQLSPSLLLGEEIPPKPGWDVVSIIVLCGDIFGTSPPPEVRVAILEMWRRSGFDLLGLNFHRSGSDWRLSSVTSNPELRIGGSDLVKAIMAASQCEVS